MKNLIAQCNFTDLHADRIKSANRMAPIEYQWPVYLYCSGQLFKKYAMRELGDVGFVLSHVRSNVLRKYGLATIIIVYFMMPCSFDQF